MGYQFAAVLAFAAVAVLLPFGLLAGFKAIRPSFPSEDKSLIYECGEKPIGRAWFNFNPRFYLVALVFVIFEVDIGLTFPVVAVYRRWVEKSPLLAWAALGELLVFTGILVAALAWVWARGDLDWVKKLEDRPERREQPAEHAEPTTSVSDRPAA
jgi:NADH-quinone oxidoreductase subunit A